MDTTEVTEQQRRNIGEKFTLSSRMIDSLREVFAGQEGMLPEDISDKDVFERIHDSSKYFSMETNEYINYCLAY